MEDVVYRSLGRKSARVTVGSGWGLDNAVIAAGGGRSLVLTVDPVSVIPAFGPDLSAWTSVHLVASDFATSGARPEFATFSYNFPPTMGKRDKEAYVRAVGRECGRLGVAIVAGHTGTYPGSGFTVVGSGSMLGFCDKDAYVSPAMARTGDAVLLTKHAAIEATASLAICFPSFTEGKVGTKVARRARGMIRQATVVADASAAMRGGLGFHGVTSMHDATEGGVLGALEEMAGASRQRFEVDLGKIMVTEEAQKVCRAFGLEPLTTMGEGALLVTCNPNSTGEVTRHLSTAGILCRQVGTVREGSGLWISKDGGRSTRFRGGRDAYWDAFDRHAESGLR